MQHKHPIKNIVLFSMIISIVIGLFAPLSAAYAVPGDITTPADVTKYSDMTPVSRALSYVFYNALSSCIENKKAQLLNPLSADSINAGKWFQNPSTGADNPTIGYFLTGAGLHLNTGQNGEKVGCGGNNTDWIAYAATTLWGYSSTLDLFCASGGEFVNNTAHPDCLSTQKDDSYTAPNNMLSMTKFRASLAAQIGTLPSLDANINKAEMYVLTADAFKAGCLGSADPSPDTNTHDSNTSNSNFFGNISFVDPTDGSLSNPQNYLGTKNRTDKIFYYINGSGNNIGATCISLVNTMNADAAAYSETVPSLPNGDTAPAIPNGDSTNADSSNTCGSSVTGLGWIVCPVINAVVGLNDILWSIIKSMLTVNPLEQNQPIYTAWGAIRSLANALFVIFFMVIIFSQLTGVGITNYGVKKMLPKIIVAAILVNVSFILMQGAVDLSNIIGSSLYSLIHSMIPNTGQHTWQLILNGILGGAFSGALGVGAVILVMGSATGFWMLIPFMLMGLLSLIAAFLTLAFRQAAIPILTILAPLAIVASGLPNTESWYKKWRGLLLSMLMLYPLAAVIFAGSEFASVMIIGTGNGIPHNFLNYLIGLTILALPLFSLPFLARQGGAIQAKIAGALNGLAQKAKPGISNMAKERAEAAKQDYLSNRPNAAIRGLQGSRNRFLRGVGNVAGAPRNAARNREYGRFKREQETEKNKLNFQEQMKQNQTRHMAESSLPSNRDVRRDGLGGQVAGHGGEQAIDNLALAKKTSRNLEQEAVHRQDTHATGMALDERGKTGEIVHKTDEAHTDHRMTQTAEGRAAHQALGEAQLQTKDDTLVIKHALDTSAAGQALNQQVGLDEKQATLDTKATTHRLETSQEGIDLNQEIGRAGYVEATDKSSTQGRIDSDPELLQERQEAAAAEEFAAAAKVENARFTAEASTEGGRDAAEAALVASGATPVDAAAIVDTLTTAKRRSDVASGGTASAQRVQKTELRNAVLADGPGGPGTPSATAVAMAGIDPHGTDRAIAGSIQEGDTEDAKHVDNASTRLTHADLPREEVRRLARGLPTVRLSGLAGDDVETRIAAQKRTVNTGDEEEIARLWDGMRNLTDFRGDPLPPEETERIRNTFAESLMASRDKSAYYTPAQIEAMRTGQPYHDTTVLIGEAVDAGRYSGAEAMVTSTNDELGQILRAAGVDIDNIDPNTHQPARIPPTLTQPQIDALRATAIAALGEPRIDERIKRTRQNVQFLSRL
jgi:hypothetical protein